MRKQASPRVPDADTVAKWRAGLIDDLGPDLLQCVRWMHSGDSTGLVVVLRSMRRCGVSELIQQGVSLYWRQLTAEKHGRSIPHGGV